MAKSKIVALGVLSQTAGNVNTTNYRGFGGTLEFVSRKPMPKKYLEYDPFNQKYYSFSVVDSEDFGTATDNASMSADGKLWVETLQVLPDPVNAVVNKFFPDYWYSRAFEDFTTGQLTDRSYYIDNGFVLNTAAVTMPDSSTYNSINPPIGLLHFMSEDAIAQGYWMDGAAGKFIYMNGTKFPVMYYRDASEPDTPVTLKSRFSMYTEPVFCIGLWRDAPPDEITETPATRINFGNTGTGAIGQSYNDSRINNAVFSRSWELIIPYYGNMSLRFRDAAITNGEWIELPSVQEGAVENEGQAVKQSSITEEGFDMQQIWVGCFGPYICISQDGFKSYTAVFDRSLAEPSDAQPFGDWLKVHASPFGITNVGGQWAVSWVPVYQSSASWIESDVHSLPYLIENNPAWDAGTIEFNPTYYPILDEYFNYEVPQSGIITYPQVEIFKTDKENTSASSTTEGHYGLDYNVALTGVVNNTGPLFGYVVTEVVNGYNVVTEEGTTRWQTLNPWPETTATYWNFNEYGWYGDGETLSGISLVNVSARGGAELPILQYRSPLLYRVDYMAPTDLQANPAMAAAGNYRLNMLSEFSFDSVENGATGSFSVDAQDSNETVAYPFGGFHDGFRMYPAGILAGWLNHDGTITIPQEVVGEEVTIDPATWQPSGGYTAIQLPLIFGYAQQPSTEIANGTVNTSFSLIDMLALCKDVSSDGTLPCFDGWYVYDAIIYLLNFLGITSDYYTGTTLEFDSVSNSWVSGTGSLIENTGLRLNKGKPYEPLWVPREGDSIVDFMNEICLYDFGAALNIRYGKITKCCPFCQALRNGDSGGGYPGSHMHPASAGCLSYDASRVSGGIDYHYITSELERTTSGLGFHPLEQEIVSLRCENDATRDNYYNSVKVKGKSTIQPYREIVKEYNDWWSILGYATIEDGVTAVDYAIGYKKQLAVEREWINSNAIAERVLAQHWLKHSGYARQISITVPFNPMHQLGQVFAVYGEAAEAIGMRNKKFRIVGVSNSYEAGGGMSNTVIRGVEIGSL